MSLRSTPAQRLWLHAAEPAETMELRGRLPDVSPVLRRVLTGLGLVGVAILILAAPVKGWWAQRAEISTAQAELDAVQSDNEVLQGRLDRIDDPTELERIARRDLGLVREGEESYTVLPPSTAGLILPDQWPFNRVAGAMTESP